MSTVKIRGSWGPHKATVAPGYSNDISPNIHICQTR